MSRQNKVNPGIYTQRGRLTQDDAARELRKQSAIGSPHTWQPVNTSTRPRPAPAGDAAGTPAPSNAKATVAKAKAARMPASAKTTGDAKPRRTTTAPTKQAARTRTTTKPTRKAALARNVGGRSAPPRPTTKRNKG